jgi:uncharacterized HAD superfamily protein
MKKTRLKVYGIDLDGVLCSGEKWPGEKHELMPITKNIKKVNELALTNFIVIHTSRKFCQAEDTMNWLMRNGVHYHAIRFEKMPGDYYVDDKFINL